MATSCEVDAGSSEEVRAFGAPRQQFFTSIVAIPGTHSAIGNIGRTLMRVDFDTSAFTPLLLARDYDFTDISVSAGGTRAAFGGAGDGLVHVWDFARNEVVFSKPAGPLKARLNPAGAHLLTSDAAMSVDLVMPNEP